MKMHANEGLGSNRVICPTEIPVNFIFIVDYSDSKTSGYFFDNRIVGDLISEDLHATFMVTWLKSGS